MDWLTVVGFIGLTLFLLFRSGPRPKLAKKTPRSLVPEDLSIAQTEQWLADQEAKNSDITEDAEARIFWSTKDTKTAMEA